MSGVPYIFANATTSIPLNQLDTNFATGITLGNTTVYLGNTTTSLGNVTLTNATISSGNIAGGIANSTITQAMFAAGVAGNGPAFFAYQSAGQSITNGSFTKVQWQSKLFDTNSNFDNTTNYRFTPTVAGYYQFNVCISMTIGSQVETNITLYKNGSATATMADIIVPAGRNAIGGYLIYLNGSTDYVETYYYTSVTGTTSTGSGSTYFSGFLARSA